MTYGWIVFLAFIYLAQVFQVFIAFVDSVFSLSTTALVNAMVPSQM